MGRGGGLTRGGSLLRPARLRLRLGRPRQGSEATRDECRVRTGAGITASGTTVVVVVGVGVVVSGVRLIFFRSARSRLIPRCISWVPSSSWYQVCDRRGGGEV